MPAILRPGLIMPIRVLPRQTLADFEMVYKNLIISRNAWWQHWNALALDYIDYHKLGATKCHIDTAADR